VLDGFRIAMIGKLFGEPFDVIRVLDSTSASSKPPPSELIMPPSNLPTTARLPSA